MVVSSEEHVLEKAEGVIVWLEGECEFPVQLSPEGG